MHFYWFYIFIFLITTLEKQSRGSSYNVAVVEYGPSLSTNLTSSERLAINVENYIDLIEDTSRKSNQSLDLIIFPETTLMYLNEFSDTTVVLPQSADIVLCNSSDENYATFLKRFSCAAINYKTTIVINFTEEQSPSNSTDVVYYNTNVAIGSNGSIIARYRKWNLFGEYGKSKPTSLDLPVIDINNTTFGMMTCFDIQFGVPAFNLTRQLGLKHIIFPLNWISELPYLTALQVQQMWAQEFNVVLLAAGASVPDVGSGGSGIYFGSQGALDSEILAEHGTKVLFQNVPTDLEAQDISDKFSDDTDESIDTLASAMDDFYMLVDPSIKDHNSVVLNTTQENTNTRICHGDEENKLCCDFNISLTMNPNTADEEGEFYTYHLVAFNGIRTYSQLYYGGVETCGLIACLTTSLESCGERFKNYSNIIWPLEFTSINITGVFAQSDQRVQFATTLLSSIRPLPLHAILWEKETSVNGTTIRRLTLKESQTRLLTFGIFGRDFDRDWDPVRNDSFGNVPNKSESIAISKIFSLMILVAFNVRSLSAY